MNFKFSKEIYSKEAILKTAYRFTDKAYIHLDYKDGYYIVNIEPKTTDSSVNEKEFVNEMLAQMVRLNINDRTKNIRELIMARALSSTVIEDDSVNETTNENGDSPVFDINEILTDWFEANE